MHACSSREAKPSTMTKTICKSLQVHNTFWNTIYTNLLQRETIYNQKQKFTKKQGMPTEYNKSHIQGFLNENGKNTTLHNFV